MAKTHYEVLGISESSTVAEIRSAYRKLVMLHHPDRSEDPKSKIIFLSAAEAYEVLSDEVKRKAYDDRLKMERKVGFKSEPATRRIYTTPSARLAELKLDINRLMMLFSRGNYPEAAVLAHSILDRDPKQPIPYAILGDIAKISGDIKLAAQMYGSAIQFDPRNVAYRQRYESIVEPAGPVVHAAARPNIAESRGSTIFAPLFGLGLILIACVYIILATELPVFPYLRMISTWTIGLIVMLFFSGVVLGSCMSLDRLLENFSSANSARGRPSPTVALATIAIVNFWAAVAMYAIFAWRWKAINHSTSRLLASSIAGTCLLALAAEASGRISGLQVFVWGGNVVYLGALCGWMAADSLRSAA